MSTHGLSDYLLGFSEEEHRRLMVQAELFDRITERAFVDAGITAGMRVLDCGSGAGDVSLIAARLVGASGHVLGLDQSPDSVARATARAETQGVSNVTFEVANLAMLDRPERFDAIVGRFIVLYLPDRERTMRQIISHLTPGGVAVFCEYDMPTGRSIPTAPLFEATLARIIRTADGAGFPSEMGAQLPHLFARIGLTDVVAEGTSRLLPGANSVVVDWVADTVRNLAPLAAKLGIVHEAEWGLATLREDMRAEMKELDVVVELPLVVAARGRA